MQFSEQKGEFERKLKVEFILGGKWKVGVEIRYQEQEVEVGRDKQEFLMNIQYLACFGAFYRI